MQMWHGKDKLAYTVRLVEGKREGKEEWFHENGQRKSVAHFKEDLPDGELTAWHEDGSRHLKQQYKEGMPVGSHKEFYPGPEKQLAKIASYKEGKLHGEQAALYPSGAMQAQAGYEEGLMHDRKALWSEEGELLEEAHFERGNLQGRSFHREADGREVVYHYNDHRKHGLHTATYPPDEAGERTRAF